MLKKLFDWTPRDIAYWEKFQHKGLGNFILTYGVVISAGLLFIIFGLITLFSWLNRLETQVTFVHVVFLLGQLVFVAVICVVFGIINSLITWLVEQRLYIKYKSRQHSAAK